MATEPLGTLSYSTSTLRDGRIPTWSDTNQRVEWKAAGSLSWAAPTAYTQTYATASRTMPAATALANADVAYDQTNENTFRTAILADVAAAKQVLNSVIDDLQAFGILQ